jgi:hypothetical protein
MLRYLFALLLLCTFSAQYTIAQTDGAQVFYVKKSPSVASDFPLAYKASGQGKVYENTFKIAQSNYDPFLAITVAWFDGSANDDNTEIEITLNNTKTGLQKKYLIHHDEHVTVSDRKVGQIIYAEKGFDEFTLKVRTALTSSTEATQLIVNTFNPKPLLDARSTGATPASSYYNNTARDISACPCPIPPYKSRTEWGCPQGQTTNATTYTTVTHLILHHSAGSNTSSNWDAVVLSIFNSHTSAATGYSDIGYNWLVAPNGQLYEGRGGGNNIQGAHYCGFNANTMGVCALGTYTTVNFPDTAKVTLTKIFAWKACNSGINPMGASPHYSVSGNLNNISGHRDGCATECPGNTNYAFLPTLRNDVQNFITSCVPCPPPGTPTITATPSATVCNGDSIKLKVTAANCGSCTYSWNTGSTADSIWVKNPGTYTVFVSNACGRVSQIRSVLFTANTPTSFSINSSGCPNSNLVFTPTSVVNGGSNPVFTWFVNGVSSGTGATFNIANATNGTQVYATMQSNGTCPTPNPSTSNTITVNCIVSAIVPIDGLSNLSLVPNPIKGFAQLKFTMATPTLINMYVVGQTGARVLEYKRELFSGTNTKTLNFSNLAAGKYQLVLVSNKGTQFLSFMKQ